MFKKHKKNNILIHQDFIVWRDHYVYSSLSLFAELSVTIRNR